MGIAGGAGMRQKCAGGTGEVVQAGEVAAQEEVETEVKVRVRKR
jgi:hypothetical protein